MLEVLHSVQGPIQAGPGCLACGIYTEETPEQAILLVERWESAAALEEHVRSGLYRRILAAIELSSRQPEVSFDDVRATKGMELIEQLRGYSEEIIPPLPPACPR